MYTLTRTLTHLRTHVAAEVLAYTRCGGHVTIERKSKVGRERRIKGKSLSRGYAQSVDERASLPFPHIYTHAMCASKRVMLARTRAHSRAHKAQTRAYRCTPREQIPRAKEV